MYWHRNRSAPPLPFPGSAAILAAILAGGTPALPGGAERLRLICSNIFVQFLD